MSVIVQDEIISEPAPRQSRRRRRPKLPPESSGQIFTNESAVAQTDSTEASAAASCMSDEMLRPLPAPAPMAGKKRKIRKQPHYKSDLADTTEEVDDRTTALGVIKDQQTVPEERPDTGLETETVDGAHMPHRRRSRKSSRRKRTATQETDGQRAEPTFSIIVHRSTALKSSTKLTHPLVRVSIVNADTGTLLTKLHRDRAVISFYETQQSGDNSVILPIMTQPFDLKANQTMAPAWQECLHVNEDVSHFASPNVILFFEVVDFLPARKAQKPKWSLPTTGGQSNPCWHCVAWAFLKTVSSSGHRNISGEEMKLQLFKAPTDFSPKIPLGILLPYHWWHSCPRVPYPACLYVTLKESLPETNSTSDARTGRSLAPTQPESGEKSFADLNREAEARLRGLGLLPAPVHNQPSIWSRLPGQPCHVPNKQLLCLRTARHGCPVFQFAHHGRLLAAACEKDGLFGITLFEIPSGHQRGELFGHHNIIYDISWENGDSNVATASSDGTVRCWAISGLDGGEAHVLTHPCFVYCVRHYPSCSRSNLLVTGGYDKLLRVWDISQQAGLLVREMEGHSGFVNSICFSSNGSSMFSADSQGVVLIWGSALTNSGSVSDWNIGKEVVDPSVKGTPINHISLHPSGRRLLLHMRDSCLRMLDLRINSCVHQYIGAKNSRERLHSCLSTCGTFVFAGSEDGQVFVWNSDTGHPVATYEDLPFKSPVSCVVFHPHDHIVAFSAFGDNQPILVYKFERSEPNISRQTASPPAGLDDKLPKQNDRRSLSLESMTSSQLLSKMQPIREDGRLSVVLEAVTVGGSKQDESHATLKQGSAPSTLRPSFEDTAAETVRLMRITNKLDSVLKGVKARRSADLRLDSTPSSLVQTDTRRLSRPPQHSFGKMSASFQPGQLSLHRPHPSLDSVGSQMSWGTIWDTSPLPQGNATSLMGTLASGQKPKFTFQPPTPSGSADTNQVIALYDYEASRADEISFQRGDIISVLFRESDNWWRGVTYDGQQGYFPASYVTEHDERAILVGSPTADREEDMQLSETALIGAPSERPLSPVLCSQAGREESQVVGAVGESDSSATHTAAHRQKNRHRRRRAKTNQ